MLFNNREVLLVPHGTVLRHLTQEVPRLAVVLDACVVVALLALDGGDPGVPLAAVPIACLLGGRVDMDPRPHGLAGIYDGTVRVYEGVDGVSVRDLAAMRYVRLAGAEDSGGIKRADERLEPYAVKVTRTVP